MRRRGIAVALGLAALLMAGGTGLARTAGPAGGLGTNLANEACRWAPAPPATDAASAAVRPRDIACAGTSQAAGTVWSTPLAEALPTAPAARHAALLRSAEATQGGISITLRMTCDGGHWLADTPGADSAVFSCALKSDGWPSIVVLARIGRTLYQAAGLPVMLPVLEAAIASASGRPLRPAETAAALDLLRAKVPPDMMRASGSDLANYKDLIELARLYSGARNYAGAEAAYRHALTIETRLFGPDAAPVGETLMEIALQVSNQGRFDEAAALFRRATPIIEAAASVTARARLVSYLALDAANQRHFAEALKYGQEATAMRRALVASAPTNGTGSGPLASASRGELAHSLRIEAEMELRLGDLPAARAAAAEALQIISSDPSLPLWWRPDAVMLVAAINAQEGRVIEAEREYREAILLQQTLFGDTAPTAFSEMRLGSFYTDQQLYPAAVDTFRSAFAILARDDVARADVVPDQILPFITAARAVAAADPKQRPALDAEIFRASQLINSSVADQTIARAAARLATDNPAIGALLRETQEAEQTRDTARVDLAAETAKPDDARNPARERQLADALQHASARADRLAARLLKAFPDYARFADPGPARLAPFQKQLSRGEAFLSFVIGESASYALLVTPDGMTVAPVALGSKQLAADISDLRQAFVPRLGVLPRFDLKASFALYSRLLGPLGPALQGIDTLIVAPSGALASLPLALLVTAPPPAAQSYRDAAWLVRKMALSEVPSARALVALRLAEAQRRLAPRPFLGIGDPDFAGTAGSGAGALDALAGRCRTHGPIAAAALRDLPPLPETAAEVETVARLEGAGAGSVLLGAAATESNLRAHPLDQYQVLYFATHAVLPGELRCDAEPALVLSPPPHPAATTEEDGLLEASEIAELKLNADLVVLSACNTAAAGGGFGGEALAGLADAFFNAGARTVLASHWQVPSAATVPLMTGVFARFGRDRSGGLAEALRQSQLARIADPATAHPFYWAAFTVIGEGDAPSRLASTPLPATPSGVTRGRS